MRESPPTPINTMPPAIMPLLRRSMRGGGPMSDGGG